MYHKNHAYVNVGFVLEKDWCYMFTAPAATGAAQELLVVLLHLCFHRLQASAPVLQTLVECLGSNMPLCQDGEARRHWNYRVELPTPSPFCNVTKIFARVTDGNSLLPWCGSPGHGRGV
jgi:hypothetical protein